MKTNTQINNLVQELRKQGNQGKVKLWRRLASDIEKPTRQRKSVNLAKIDYMTNEDEIIVVPGKVLGGGQLSHKLTVAALNFSRQALEKIENSSCQAYSIAELMKNNPEGKNVRILI
ncbi:MAG: 50S ribosomal protein L18e [Nanobdellota archaeon]